MIKRIFLIFFLIPILMIGSSVPSKPKVLLASILIPGGGEFLLGHRKTAISMFVAEGLVWAGYFSFRWYGGNIRNNYMQQASSYAGAYSGTNDDNYWDAVEWYLNTEGYNRKVREDARELYPDNWEEQQRYIEENSYTGIYEWDWTNLDSQYDFYRKMRVDSRQMFQNASFVALGAIVTRVVSLAWTVKSLRDLPAMENVQPEIEFTPYSWQVGFRIDGLFR